MTFPAKVFEDVSGTDFLKHNKKHVTEDFVGENFKDLGWDVYRPFNDTGIDLIITKKCCPQYHDQSDVNSNNELCDVCNKELILITRFIQVKTREVKETNGQGVIFGYTLKSKDFRTDPRHVFLLYSDYTNDFIIIPMYEYLKIFYENENVGKAHFGTPSFRQGNNKLNNLKYYKNYNRWEWSVKGRSRNILFNKFVNESGVELISNPDYDINIDKYTKKISEMKMKVFYTYSKGKQVNQEMELEINEYLKNKTMENIDSISNIRSDTLEKLKNELPSELIESIENGYFVKFKGVSFYD